VSLARWRELVLDQCSSMSCLCLWGKTFLAVFIASDFLNIIYPVLFFRIKYFDFLSHFANDVRSASFQETLLQRNFILLKLCIIILYQE
jgi:hypothetical protein